MCPMSFSTLFWIFYITAIFSLETFRNRQTSTIPAESVSLLTQIRSKRADFIDSFPLKPLSNAGGFFPVVKIKIIPTRNFRRVGIQLRPDCLGVRKNETCTRMIFFSTRKNRFEIFRAWLRRGIRAFAFRYENTFAVLGKANLFWWMILVEIF